MINVRQITKIKYNLDLTQLLLFESSQFKMNRGSLLVLLVLINTWALAQTITLTVSSSSSVVGKLANYSLTLSAPTSITQVDFTFSTWTDSNNDPFTSNTQVLFAGLTLTPVYFPQKLICLLGSTSTGSTFTITNIYNPSSTKSAPITITLYPSSGSPSSQTASLTMSTISNSSFSLSKYSTVLGTTSSSVQFYLFPKYSLQFTSTTLKITYNPNLITITLGTSTDYTLVSQINGEIVLGSFSTGSNLLKIANVTIVNPQAAVTYTIDCLFRITSAGNLYEVQRFSNTLTLNTVQFSTISTTSSLNYGIENSLLLTSTCPYNSVNDGSNVPTTLLTYNSTQLSFNAASTCQATSSSTCQFIHTGSDSLTLLTPLIVSFSSTTITLTSRTYLNGQLYSLCQSTLTIPVSPQTFTASIDTSQCTSNVVNGENSINIAFTAKGVSVGDKIYLKGLTGTVQDSLWSSQIIDGTTWYYYSLKTTDLSTTGSTTSGTASLTYLNPSYTSSPILTNVGLSHSSFMFALATGPSLCPVTTPLTIATSSLSQTTSLTYSPSSLTLQLTLSLFDYQPNDHILLSFTSTSKANQYLLLSSYLSLTYGVTINGVSTTALKNNNTSIWVEFGGGVLPSQSNPVLTIKVNNLVNPPYASSVSIDVSTHEANSNGTKEILSTSSLAYVPSALEYSADNLLLLRNNTVTMTLYNPYRNILKINSSSFTTLTITVPSALSCPNLPNSTLTLNWQSSVTTSGTLYSGNTTHLTLTLGQCYASYFTGNALFTVSETYNGSQSTSTSPALSNLCGDNCYDCSGSACTTCFNSTYSTANLLFGGTCYSSCPNGSYKLSSSSCAACHTSCSTCSGPTYTECNTCANNYTNQSGICLSVCGAGKYLSDNTCQSCHVNCQACLSSSSCYVCNTNATMISSQCYFTSCQANCLTCEGTQFTCTSCPSGYNLYDQQCLEACPSGTYQTSESTCQEITQANTYIPITLTGLICVLALLALRVYSSKKVGSQLKRSKDYRQEEPMLYKINLWRVVAVLYAFLEIIAAIVMAYKNSSYNVSSPASPAAITGLIFHLILNIIFIIGYCLISRKARVANEQIPSEQPIKLRQKVVLILSFLSLRSYRLLQANLFLDRPSPSQQQQSINPMASIPRKEQVPINKTETKQKEPLRETDKQNINRSNLKNKQSNLKSSEGKVDSVTPSKKAIRINGIGDQINQEGPIKRTDSHIVSEEGIIQKRVNYPLLCYLSLASLITATLTLLIAACLQLVTSNFSHTLFTGIDALIVTAISLFLSSWDLWNAQNLTPQQLNSQVSSQQVNNTHQNLKQAAEMEVQVYIEANQGKSGIRPKRTNRSWGQQSKEAKSKSKGRGEAQDQIDQKPPLLKVFQDLDESEKTYAKETKTKKFSTKNLRYGKKVPKNNISVSHTRKQLQGELWDDLYINFQSNRPERDASTTYNYQKSQRSVSPNHSLGQKQLDLEGNFQEQPPIFPDISDIQDPKVEEARQMSPESDELDPSGL